MVAVIGFLEDTFGAGATKMLAFSDLRFDKFVVFSARQVRIMNLDIPRCGEGSEMERAKLSQGEMFCHGPSL